jgi:hypothetical protein
MDDGGPFLGSSGRCRLKRVVLAIENQEHGDTQ